MGSPLTLTCFTSYQHSTDLDLRFGSASSLVCSLIWSANKTFGRADFRNFELGLKMLRFIFTVQTPFWGGRFLDPDEKISMSFYLRNYCLQIYFEEVQSFVYEISSNCEQFETLNLEDSLSSILFFVLKYVSRLAICHLFTK
jgi:hypothetical protein